MPLRAVMTLPDEGILLFPDAGSPGELYCPVYESRVWGRKPPFSPGPIAQGSHDSPSPCPVFGLLPRPAEGVVCGDIRWAVTHGGADTSLPGIASITYNKP